MSASLPARPPVGSAVAGPVVAESDPFPFPELGRYHPDRGHRTGRGRPARVPDGPASVLLETDLGLPAQRAYLPAEPPARRDRSRGFVLGLAVSAILVFAASALAVGGGLPQWPGGSGRGGTLLAAAPAPQPLRAGDVAADGDVRFVVEKVRFRARRIGTRYLNAKPTGRFVLVTVRVTNAGSTPMTFTDVDQRLMAGGVAYTPDPGAGLLINARSPRWLEELAPGRSMRGVLVFDVPRRVAPETLTLHAAPESAGVTVALALPNGA